MRICRKRNKMRVDKPNCRCLSLSRTRANPDMRIHRLRHSLRVIMHKIAIKMREVWRSILLLIDARHVRLCANEVCICGCAKYVRWPQREKICCCSAKSISSLLYAIYTNELCTPLEAFWVPAARERAKLSLSEHETLAQSFSVWLRNFAQLWSTTAST